MYSLLLLLLLLHDKSCIFALDIVASFSPARLRKPTSVAVSAQAVFPFVHQVNIEEITRWLAEGDRKW